MRLKVAFVFAVVMSLALMACEPDEPAPPPVDPTPPPEEPTPPPEPPDENGAQLGEAIFTGAEPAAQPSCNTCHSVGTDDRVGPGLGGVATRAAERVEGLTAEEYLRQAIVDPAEHIVEGFPPAMPTDYGEQLSDEELDALVAYLMTLQ